MARIIGNYLKAAARGLARLEKPADPKGLHAFRVVIRRLRSLLRRYRPWLPRVAGRKLRRRLRELTRTTNTARDADVEIDWLLSQRDLLARDERSGFTWLLRRVQGRRRRGYASARKKLGRDFARVVRLIGNRIDDTDEPEQRPFRATFLDLLEPGVTVLRGKENIHKSRIQVKRLRYLVEPLRQELAEARVLVRPLKHLQGLLGELHDMQVLEEEIAQGIEEAASEKARRLHRLAVDGAVASRARERRRDESLGLLALASRAREQRDRLYAEFERAWLSNRQFELRDQIVALRAAIGPGNASGSSAV
ncbi:MAG: CHAD domain-containing protein [Steroidobacteraceae bacterium]